MSRLGGHRSLWLALLCAVAAGILVLLAVDARAWHRTMQRDDLRFRALPSHLALWHPSTILPGDPAAALLGTKDALAYRRAVQLFWYSRIGSNPEDQQDLPTMRAEAQQRLQDLTLQGVNGPERSYAANLLGVLVVTTPTPTDDRAAIRKILERATGYFQQAIRLDSLNSDAKLNLELVLRIEDPGKGRLGRDARSGYGAGRGHSVVPVGGGY
jgi:hypothetical protein